MKRKNRFWATLNSRKCLRGRIPESKDNDKRLQTYKQQSDTQTSCTQG